MDKDIEARKKELAGHLVSLIEVVLGFVIASSLITYSALLITPQSDLVGAGALLSVYLMATLGWIHWHRGIVLWPYTVHLEPANGSRRSDGASDGQFGVMTPQDDRANRRSWNARTLDTLRRLPRTILLFLREAPWRLVIDLMIIAFYARALASASILIEAPDADATAFLINFPIVYLLYALWVLRGRKLYPKMPDASGRHFLAAIMFGVVTLAYWARTVVPDAMPPFFTNLDATALNVAMVILVSVMVFLFRATSGSFAAGAR